MAVFPVIENDPRRFPMPTLEQGSPFGGVLSNMIAKRLAMAKAQEAEAEVPYAGISKLADVLSKSAYASAVTPQFQAKLLENPNILPNITDPKKRLDTILNYTNNANLNAGLYPTINNELMKISNQQNQPGLLGQLGQGIKNLFTSNQGLQPVLTNNVQSTAQPMVQQPSPTVPAQTTEPTSQGAAPATSQTNAISSEANDFQQRTMRYQQLTEQAKSAGRTFGANQENAINDLNSQYWDSSNYLSSIHEMNKTITNPIFQNIVDVPFASQHSIGWYKNMGSKAQQELIGNFLGEQSQLIRNFVTQFKGQSSKKEIDLAESSKVNEKDMPSVMVGKQQSLTYLTTLANQRLALTAEIMAKEGLRQTDALKKADTLLNGDAIRKQVSNELHPSKKESSQYYAKTPDEWHNGKQAEAVKTVNGKRMLKIGNQWYEE